MAGLDTLISGRNYTLPIPLNTGVAASRVFRDPICWRDPIRRHPIGCPGPLGEHIRFQYPAAVTQAAFAPSYPPKLTPNDARLMCSTSHTFARWNACARCSKQDGQSYSPRARQSADLKNVS